MVVNLNPKSKEIENIFDRLMRYPNLEVDTRVAQDISRIKPIRFLREKKQFHISNDRKIGISILSVPENVKIKKKSKQGFFFDF